MHEISNINRMANKPKYKHTTYFRKSDLENIGYSIWSPTIRDWRDVIEDYIYISKKRRNNKLAMFKLQIDLLENILLITKQLNTYKALLEEPEERKIQFPDREINEKDLEYWEREFKTTKLILNALKDIGDGIAWRVFGYDRSIIYNMCVNNSEPGPITVNQGLITELHSMGDFSNDQEVKNFVYHGITNFLLISDLTILLDGDEINFIEIKSGKNSRGKSWRERLERQERRVKNIVSIGNTAEGISSNVLTKFRLVNQKPKTLLNRFDTLFKRARQQLITTQVFNSYLGIATINFEYASEGSSKEIIDNKLIKLECQIRKNDNDILISPNNVKNLIFSPNRAPSSVHPYDQEDIANILLGKYFVIYYFNVSRFIKEIEKRGWKVFDLIYDRDREQNDNFDANSMFSVSKDRLRLSVPPFLTARAIYEGLSVDSLVQIFEDTLRKGPIDLKHAIFYGYEKEKYLWD